MKAQLTEMYHNVQRLRLSTKWPDQMTLDSRLLAVEHALRQAIEEASKEARN